jgi:hypothetical protein
MASDPLRIACLLTTLLICSTDAGSQTPSGAPSSLSRPCVNAPEHRAFDFWLGEWDVRPAAHPERPPSRSRIELVEDGCVLQELYTTPAGYSGRSLNIYDADKARWEQFWVDNQGGLHHYVGQARDGNLYYEAESVRLPSEPAPVRLKMTFFNQGKDRVRQLIEKSTDGGRTYAALWDLIYVRRR